MAKKTKTEKIVAFDDDSVADVRLHYADAATGGVLLVTCTVTTNEPTRTEGNTRRASEVFTAAEEQQLKQFVAKAHKVALAALGFV